MDDMTLDQAVAAVKRVAAANASPDITPAPLPNDIVTAFEVLAGYVNGDQVGNYALADLRRAFQAHYDVTWQLARFHDHQVGGVGTGFHAEYTRRWLQLMVAFRAAMEM